MKPLTIGLIAGGALLLASRSHASTSGPDNPTPGTVYTAGTGSSGTGAPPPGAIVGPDGWYVPPPGGASHASLGSLLDSIGGLIKSATGGVQSGLAGPAGPAPAPPAPPPPPPPVVHDAGVTAATSATVTLQDLYAKVLHRAPDAGGLAYWENTFGGDVVTQDERAAFMAAAIPELQAQAQR